MCRVVLCPSDRIVQRCLGACRAAFSSEWLPSRGRLVVLNLRRCLARLRVCQRLIGRLLALRLVLIRVREAASADGRSSEDSALGDTSRWTQQKRGTTEHGWLE